MRATGGFEIRQLKRSPTGRGNEARSCMRKPGVNGQKRRPAFILIGVGAAVIAIIALMTADGGMTGRTGETLCWKAEAEGFEPSVEVLAPTTVYRTLVSGR